MRAQHMATRFGGRKGFALLVAVGVLIVLVFSGAAIQQAAFVEVWDVRQAVGRAHARLAASGGLEAGLAETGDFAAKGEAERTIGGTVGESRYRVTLRKTTAGEAGPALGWLNSERSLVLLSIEGNYRPRPAESGGETGESVGFIHRTTAVVDPAEAPYRILVWVNE